MQLGQNERAVDALNHARQLDPDAPGLRALEIILLSRTGQEVQARQKLSDYYDQDRYDYALVQAGYELGLKTQNWQLAIRSLELRKQTWPEQAADAYLHLGIIYATPKVNDDANALAAFRAGLRVVPLAQKNKYLSQVPERYRVQL